jgi:hypothetical protein
VLIRCRHGINHSALVAGLVLRERGWDGEEVIAAIRRARPGALTNPYFLDLICDWPDDPMGRFRHMTAPLANNDLGSDSG